MTEPDHARVLLANINPGQVSAVFTEGLINSLASGRLKGTHLGHSGPYLDYGRNLAVKSCLDHHLSLGPDSEHQFDWLLFVDSDMAFGPDHIDMLFRPTLHPDYSPQSYPVIAGLYRNPYGQFEEVRPVCFQWLFGRPVDLPPEEQDCWYYDTMSDDGVAMSNPVEEEWNYSEAHGDMAVTAVDAVGTGFMAIHVSFLLAMQDLFSRPNPWFAEPIVGPLQLGEDIGFCHRVKAMGYPVLVNRACVVPHHKTMIVV